MTPKLAGRLWKGASTVWSAARAPAKALLVSISVAACDGDATGAPTPAESGFRVLGPATPVAPGSSVALSALLHDEPVVAQWRQVSGPQVGFTVDENARLAFVAPMALTDQTFGFEATYVGSTAHVAQAVVDVAPAPLFEVAPLEQDGRWFKDQTGRTVILQGPFRVWKPRGPPADAPELTEPAFSTYLRDLGMNIVRLAYMWDALEPSPGAYDEEYLERVATLVAQFKAANLFTLIDSHQDMYSPKYGERANGFPDWAAIDNGLFTGVDLGFPANYFLPAASMAFDNFWRNTDGIQEAYAKQLAYVAKRFASEPYILGYDLMNEPWPGSAYALCISPLGCPAFDRNWLQPAMERFAKAVIEAHPTAIPFFEPNFMFNSGAATSLAAPTAESLQGTQLGFSFHDICLSRAVRQILDLPELGTLLDQLACPTLHGVVYGNVNVAVERMGAAPLMTEFMPADETNTEQLECLMELAEDNRMSWTFGQFPRESNMLAMARVFPRATAGEPLAYRFDPRSGHFDFRYAPDHGVPAPTFIAVPVHIHYPNGYEITVRGGSVLSAPNAREAAIAADENVDEVTVSLRPVEPDAQVVRASFAPCR